MTWPHWVCNMYCVCMRQRSANPIDGIALDEMQSITKWQNNIDHFKFVVCFMFFPLVCCIRIVWIVCYRLKFDNWTFFLSLNFILVGDEFMKHYFDGCLINCWNQHDLCYCHHLRTITFDAGCQSKLCALKYSLWSFSLSFWFGPSISLFKPMFFICRIHELRLW